jgi:sugar O-acyltransferase (sialic acid O-acetyltransferase NeuD family)
MINANGPHKLKQIVIFGAGGHAVSVANVALSAGYNIKFFIDKKRKGSNLLGYNVLENILEIDDCENICFAIGVGDNAVRENAYKELIALRPELYFPALIHNSSVVSNFTEIGHGTVVMPNAVVGPNSKIGNFCLINTRSSIDHDSSMLDFSSLAPAAVTGGNVTIGFRAAISIGASVKHGVSIGDDSVLGANSYLNKDLENNQVAYGTPAKKIRTRKVGDAYLS